MLLAVSLSIAGMELNILNDLYQNVEIELFDLHEEGSGEKDGNENSENELNSEYLLNSSSSFTLLRELNTSNNHHSIVLLPEYTTDIPIPPPEYLY